MVGLLLAVACAGQAQHACMPAPYRVAMQWCMPKGEAWEDKHPYVPAPYRVVMRTSVGCMAHMKGCTLVSWRPPSMLKPTSVDTCLQW